MPRPKIGGTMKYIIMLLLLSGCASKLIIVEDCVKAQDNLFVCKKK
jgi:hypothetical protein